ncbi:MAG: hypothetical protein RBR71_02965 [Gudongella sp.]|nr:hypothetical protein [Gudongella sp.]
MHLKKTIYSLFFVLLLMLLIRPLKINAMSTTEETIIINDFSHYTQHNFNYNGIGKFFIRKIESSKPFKYWTGYYLPGESGTLSYFDNNKQLVTIPLKDGPLPSGKILFLSTDSYNLILGQGYTYKDLGSGTVDSQSSLPISIKKVGSSYLINYSYNLTENIFGILWGLGSKDILVDLNKPNLNLIWRNYDFDKNARILFDGYHFKSPSSYLPHTANSYWRIPSSYLTNSLIRTGGSLASNILGNALLQIESKNIQPEGFLPTLPRSTWLYNDYGIGSGFFDTRFNADTIETNIIAWRKFRVPQYRENYLKLSDYYIKHFENNHYGFFDSMGNEGYLVDDYFYPRAKYSHVSLNHQLQAIHIFYMLYETEKDIKYLNIADKMLIGIKVTRDRWIMANGNLIYAYMPDGTMGLTDYPFLTYNDLVAVQTDLQRIKGIKDPDIEVLINTKKLWMDRNNITGYNPAF